MARESITLFTRLPQPGRSKTRMIPALGATAAAELQKRMSLRVITHCQQAARHRDAVFELALSELPEDAQAPFGLALPMHAQGPGDLGERMTASFARGREQGAQRQVIIGGDCPLAGPESITAALEALEEHDVVLGPAEDGGYYLIGASRPLDPAWFRGIDWGTDRVLEQSLERFRAAQLSFHLLARRADVDRPEDLPAWQRIARRWPELDRDSPISIIIPVLDEESRLAELLPDLCGQPGLEVIVADGGSRDRSREIARKSGARVFECPAGRARQMNLGAHHARAPILLFLHADSHLPAGWHEALRAAICPEGHVAGAFRFALDRGDGLRWRLIEFLTNLRARLLKLPYGDQGLFCRREAFHALDGFPDIPVMEDYSLVRELRREGRMVMMDRPLVSSARNWERAGFWRVFAVHQAVLLGWHLGVSPRRLARWRQRALARTS